MLVCVQMTGAATAKGTGGSDGTSCTATLALISDALSTPSVTASQQVRLPPPSLGLSCSAGYSAAYNGWLPPSLTQVAFYFNSPSTVTAATAYQCRLSDAAGSTSGGKLHDWRTCTSPDTYNGVPDGIYAYQVRSVVLACCAGIFMYCRKLYCCGLSCRGLYLYLLLPGPAARAGRRGHAAVHRRQHPSRHRVILDAALGRQPANEPGQRRLHVLCEGPHGRQLQLPHQPGGGGSGPTALQEFPDGA